MDIRKPTIEEFEEVKIAANRMKLDMANISMNQFDCAFSECGLAGFVRINSRGSVNELATLGIIKKFRNQGVGSLLINKLKSRYSKIHLVSVIPWFFKGYGFQKVKIIPKELIKKYKNAASWHDYGNPVVMVWEAN